MTTHQRSQMSRNETPVLIRAGATLALLGLGLLAGIATADVLYVDDDAPSGGDGLSWDTAYRFLQDALQDAAGGRGQIHEIRVAQGLYRPDRDEVHPDGTGDRQATFWLVNGVELLGGFAGLGAPDPDERDIVLYETVLSGDLAGDDKPDFVNYEENSFHIVTGNGCYETTVIDGFTIQSGNGNGAYDLDQDRGGGMVNLFGSPTVSNCTFQANLSDFHGGAMYNYKQGPSILDCTFIDNASNGEYGQGGAIFNYFSAPMIAACTFEANFATRGGAVVNDFGAPCMVDCIFVHNEAIDSGGAVRNEGYTTAEVDGCTFMANTADEGGGLFNAGNCTPTIVNGLFIENTAHSGGGACNTAYRPEFLNCEFARNQAAYGAGLYTEGPSYSTNTPIYIGCRFFSNHATYDGGGIYSKGGTHNHTCVSFVNCLVIGNDAGDQGGAMFEYTYGGAAILANSVLAANSAPIAGGIWCSVGTGHVYNTNVRDCGDDSIVGPLVVMFSNIEGGHEGLGNIDADPLFVRNPDPGADGVWGTDDDDYGDLHLTAGSPCIDAGHNGAIPADVPDLDEDGCTAERIPFDYEGNARFADDPDTDDTGCGLPVVVDMGPYEFPGAEAGQILIADINADGAVDTLDLLELLAAWGEQTEACCPSDLNFDWVVDVLDLLTVLGHWGACE